MLTFRKSMMISLVMVLIILSACTKSASTPTETGTQTSAAPDAQKEVDPYGKYDNPITINIGQKVDPSDKSLPPGDTAENNQYTRYLKDNLNIVVKDSWQASIANYDQKVNLSISSNDLPDALVVSESQLRQMVKSNQLQDLTEVYNKVASPLVKKIIDSTNGLALKSATFDGKLMAIPNTVSEDMQMLWIRKDWLDKLGLQPPKTMAELEEVAKAFVEKDPGGNGKGGTVGITGPELGTPMYSNFLSDGNRPFMFDTLFAAFNSYPGFWLKGSDGKPVYGSTLPETKAALAKLRELYANGLIDKEMGIRKDSSELIVNGKSGIFFARFWMGYWPLPDAIKNDPKANWQAYALPLDAGGGKFNSKFYSPSNTYLVVRKGYEHPDAAVKTLNLFLRDESKLDVKVALTNVPLRFVFAPRDELAYTAKAIAEVLAGTKKPEDFADKPEYKLLQADLENIKKVKLEPYDKLDIQYWNIQADPGVWSREYSVLVAGSNILQPLNRVYSEIYSQTKTMESRWVNLDKLETEAFLKIVLGAAPLDSFDQFVNEWKKQGGDQITAEVEEFMKM